MALAAIPTQTDNSAESVALREVRDNLGSSLWYRRRVEVSFTDEHESEARTARVSER